MKIQKLLGLILVSTTISLPVVQAVSAFIERSCNLEGWRGSTFDKAFNQAINFAAIASRRLKDTNDVDAQNYFSYVFGSNNNKDEVLRRQPTCFSIEMSDLPNRYLGWAIKHNKNQ